ncbi:hypothetical protein SAY86_008655 [Trapa natans]|uniref:Uncharacterized protein n=1 Tax=Trapa natans TaxID=22666 RepID=A0AAN7QBC2_TRANT|nr:hypothetical protein SAY86_008655 [Trapa natans]
MSEGGLLEELSAAENSDSRQLDYDRDGFRTPVSEHQKIPSARSCPPAPRKRRPPVTPRKRKLMQFFEATGREEVESFFELTMLNNKPDHKRRCTSL